MKTSGLKAFSFLMVLTVLLSWVACTETPLDEDGRVSIEISGEINEKDFDLNTDYVNHLNHPIQFILFQFYLSHLELVKADGSVYEFEEVLLYKLDQPENLSFEIPAGDYTALRFDLGLDSLLNNSDPNNFAVEHPLSYAQNTHWGWASKYKFIMINGRIDTLSNANFARTFAYHTGFNPLLRDIELNAPISVSQETPVQLKIALDLDQVFDGTDGSIDMYEENASHSLTDLATTLTNNFSKAFTITIE